MDDYDQIKHVEISMNENEEEYASDSLKNNSTRYESGNAYRNILKHFGIFTILKETEVEELRLIYPDKNKISSYLNRRLELSVENFKHLAKLEVFILLTLFCFEKKLDVYEICSIFSIIWDTLSMNFQKNSKRRVFNNFKEAIVKHSVDRPPFQIGIYKKESLELISDFFIDTIYTKFELLLYLTTDKKLIELSNTELFNYSLPHTMDIEMGEEVLPRQNKILRPYYETRKPKSELEQKIDKILEFERERVDKELKEKFNEQDTQFNKRLEEIISKKKK
jgi:hypothetical protein